LTVSVSSFLHALNLIGKVLEGLESFNPAPLLMILDLLNGGLCFAFASALDRTRNWPLVQR